MIIDCHAHIGNNKHIKASVEELVLSMEEAKIDKTFVFANKTFDCPNEFVLEQVKKYPNQLLAVAAYLHEAQKDTIGLPFAEWYQSKRIVAVKFYTGYEHFYPRDAHYCLDSLNEAGCPAIFHSGDCLNSASHAKLKYAHPLHIDEVAVDYPNMNFIIAHMGNPWVKDTAEVCYKNPNIYTDISGFVYGEFSNDDRVKFRKLVYEFLDIAGTDRLLFGTDWPISNQSSYLETLDWLATNTTDKKISECFTPEYLTQNVIKAFKL